VGAAAWVRQESAVKEGVPKEADAKLEKKV